MGQIHSLCMGYVGCFGKGVYRDGSGTSGNASKQEIWPLSEKHYHPTWDSRWSLGTPSHPPLRPPGAPPTQPSSKYAVTSPSGLPDLPHDPGDFSLSLATVVRTETGRMPHSTVPRCSVQTGDADILLGGLLQRRTRGSNPNGRLPCAGNGSPASPHQSPPCAGLVAMLLLLA